MNRYIENGFVRRHNIQAWAVFVGLIHLVAILVMIFDLRPTLTRVRRYQPLQHGYRHVTRHGTLLDVCTKTMSQPTNTSFTVTLLVCHVQIVRVYYAPTVTKAYSFNAVGQPSVSHNEG